MTAGLGAAPEPKRNREERDAALEQLVIDYREHLINIDTFFRGLNELGVVEHFLENHAFGLSVDEKEDVLQEIMLRLLRLGRSFDRARGTFKPWLYRVCINARNDYLLSRKTEPSSKAHAGDLMYDPRRTYLDSDRLIVAQALKRVSKHQQDLLSLKYVEGFTDKQLAETFSLPTTTIKRHIRKALEKLRKVFGSNKQPPGASSSRHDGIGEHWTSARRLSLTMKCFLVLTADTRRSSVVDWTDDEIRDLLKRQVSAEEKRENQMCFEVALSRVIEATKHDTLVTQSESDTEFIALYARRRKPKIYPRLISVASIAALERLCVSLFTPRRALAAAAALLLIAPSHISIDNAQIGSREVATTKGRVFQTVVSTEGTLFGTVTDQSGSAIPGAIVTVTGADRRSSVTTTNSAGNYTLKVLPGYYTVVVHAVGFGATGQRGLAVAARDTVRSDIGLTLGDVHGQVELMAQAPLLNSDPSDAASTYSAKQLNALAALPAFDRTFQAYELLQPGTDRLDLERLRTSKWKPKKPIVPAIESVSVDEISVGGGIERRVTAVVSYAKGIAAIAFETIGIGVARGHRLTAHYEPSTNIFQLNSDDGSRWIGTCVPGSAAFIGNSQGRLDCSSTSVSSFENVLSIKVSLVPTADFDSELYPISVYVRDRAGRSAVRTLERGHAPHEASPANELRDK